MAILAAGSSAPETMPRSASAPLSPNSVAPTNPRCTSRSDGIGFLQNRLCDRSLVLQHVEPGQVDVPFDQRRLGAEAVDRRAVERPYGRRDARPVRIDETRPAGVEARQVNLGHRLARDRGEIDARIETVVYCIHVDVVDVEQQLAAGTSCDCGDE